MLDSYLPEIVFAIYLHLGIIAAICVWVIGRKK